VNEGYDAMDRQLLLLLLAFGVLLGVTVLILFLAASLPHP